MKNKIFTLVVITCLVASCSAADFRKSVGISKPAPDEFMVQPREKLKIPTTATALPEPEKKKDAAVVASESGREALFGVKSSGKKENSALENAILNKTGADKADSAIRKTINKEAKDETGVFGTERGGTLEAILDPFDHNAPKDPVVDGKKETKRIKAAIASGQKVDAEGVKKLEYKEAKKKITEKGNNIKLNQPKVKPAPVEEDAEGDAPKKIFEEPELH